MEQEERGRVFRRAWVTGVNKYFPGEPKPGYIAPWEEMPEWEQLSAITVYNKVQSLIVSGRRHNPPVRLTPDIGGQFIAEAWNVQVFKRLSNPKPGYVADWEDLPEWQRQTDRDIFSAIEQSVLQDENN